MRTILSGFYLVLLVLLPWMHMPAHSHNHADEVHSAHTCGGHHDSDDDKKSEEPHDCGLCSLAVIQADLPLVFTFPEPHFIFFNEWSFELQRVDAPISKFHRARAPPFWSV